MHCMWRAFDVAKNCQQSAAKTAAMSTTPTLLHVCVKNKVCLALEGCTTAIAAVQAYLSCFICMLHMFWVICTKIVHGMSQRRAGLCTRGCAGPLKTSPCCTTGGIARQRQRQPTIECRKPQRNPPCPAHSQPLCSAACCSLANKTHACLAGAHTTSGVY
ncbi:hypothetical protein COO60DRAFT_764168 [Scenedesmus sp. NREL 46B-D3]|nr:hypothetical protein COO60DRAFT_764168 [Scenedesmus sp. NREL 46B-D3]